MSTTTVGEAPCLPGRRYEWELIFAVGRPNRAEREGTVAGWGRDGRDPSETRGRAAQKKRTNTDTVAVAVVACDAQSQSRIK